MKRTILALILILFACLPWARVPLGLAQSMGDKMLDLLGKDYPPEEPLLPPDIKYEQEYKDGEGEPAGLIDFAENDAYVVHAEDKLTAYRAKKSKVVCTGDMLVALVNSRLVLLMNNQSRFTLAAYSKMTIEKSIFDPEKNSRDVVLDLAVGKARIVAKKLQETGEDYKVKTPVATCGIRGSDFVVSLVPTANIKEKQLGWLDILNPLAAQAADSPPSLLVLTGEHTTISVTGQTGPPVILEPFHMTSVSYGQAPSSPFGVSPSQVPGVMNSVGPGVAVMHGPSLYE